MQKTKIDNWIAWSFANKQLGEMSCEMIARTILMQMQDATYVSVFEDDENGAEVFHGNEL